MVLAVVGQHTDHSGHSGSADVVAAAAVVAVVEHTAAAAEPVVAVGWPYQACQECWQYRPDHSVVQRPAAVEVVLELELAVALGRSRFRAASEASHCPTAQRHAPSLVLELLLVAADTVAVVGIAA